VRAWWLVVLAACKLNFDDARTRDAGASGDASSDGVSTDAAVLGPFGPPQLMMSLSTAGDPDVGPSIGTNDLELYFTSTRVGGYTLWSSMRSMPGQAFPAPLRRVELDMNGPIEFDAEVTVDGLELYYGSNAVPDGVRVTTRASTADAWSAASPLSLGAGRTGVSLYADDLRMMIAPQEYGRPSRAANWTLLRAHAALSSLAYVTLTNDGLELFGTDGTQKLHRATRASIDDPFGAPVPFSLGSSFDAVMIADPELSHDGRSLYFGAQVAANYDLYVTTR
jgi:hypothetical protein